MTLEPIGDQILVVPDPLPEKSKGGIYTPDYAQGGRDPNTENYRSGVVAFVGPACKQVKERDRVWYPFHEGRGAPIGDVTYRLLYEESVVREVAK